MIALQHISTGGIPHCMTDQSHGTVSLQAERKEFVRVIFSRYNALSGAAAT